MLATTLGLWSTKLYPCTDNGNNHRGAAPTFLLRHDDTTDASRPIYAACFDWLNACWQAFSLALLADADKEFTLGCCVAGAYMLSRAAESGRTDQASASTDSRKTLMQDICCCTLCRQGLCLLLQVPRC